MSATHLARRILLLLVLTLLATARADAQPLKDSTALKYIPADAAMFSSSLRLREQYDAFVGSNAFARLKSMPIVQMGWQVLQQELDSGDLGQFMEAMQQPENQQLVDLVIDGVSHEIFLYGDDGIADLVQLMMQLNQLNQSVQLAALQGGNQEQMQRLAFHQAIALATERLQKMDVPQLVIGFRLSNTEPVAAQLARLETLLNEQFTEAPVPALQGRLTREQLAGTEFLTLKLDGTLFPWDEIPDELNSPQMQQLRELVSKKTLTVSLGVLHGYLLLSAGPSNDHLALFGQGDLLVDSEYIAPLLEHQDQRVSTISYASGELLERFNSLNFAQIDQAIGVATGFASLAGLNEEDHKALVQDIQLLGADLKAAVPKPGTMAGIGFLTERGYESYSYDWSEHKLADSSKPLSILDHVGGDPILAVAARNKPSPDAYDGLVKWIGKIYCWADKIGSQQLGPDDREVYEQVRGELEPLFKRLDQVTREMLLPAFEGQSAFVLDAKTTNTQWHTALPPSDTPLPMLELALVYALSDAESLKTAVAEYYTIAQKIVDTLHRAVPDGIPEITIPLAESREFPSGTIYFYKLPGFLGLARHIAPNAGLSQDTLVLSTIPLMTRRLLEEHPLRSSGPLADRDRPLASAVHFDFAALIDAIAPWVDYGLSFVGDDLPPGTMEQVDTAVDILKCFRGATSVSYLDGDVMVTHAESVFQDLPSP